MGILSNLHSPKLKPKRRVGRGFASGHGKTAGRGTKGQMARSGRKKKAWFEGGQTPLLHRIPKRGFNNPCKTVYKIINVGMLERFEPNTVIDPEFLKKQGLLKTRLPLKILGEGEITKPFTVRAHKFSKKAKEKIEACNGKVEEIKL